MNENQTLKFNSDIIMIIHGKSKYHTTLYQSPREQSRPFTINDTYILMFCFISCRGSESIAAHIYTCYV